MAVITFTGLRAWLVQRVTAVYMLAFIVLFLTRFAIAPPRSYDQWHEWMSGAAMIAATVLFFAALLTHAWVGLRDVVLDYVHVVALRAVLLPLLALGLVVLGTWIVRIFWTIGA
jgi:succinate dehydrogenase / fumarate reductase membrane anchor subunit